jgi:4-amino-4-deoxy-L-arabinose transferase-like glycosyltransferase
MVDIEGTTEAQERQRPARDEPPRGGAQILPLVLLLLVLLAGSWFRLAEIGMRDFHVDELNHLYAAKSLAEGEGPLLPSGAVYTRGIDITRLSGLAAGLTAEPETGSRLPSALFGILGMVLLAAVAWRVAGPWAAFWATLLLAIYPEAVAQSRHIRFYTYQMVFGIAALYAGWRALDGAGRREEPDSTELRNRWLWTGLAVLAFALALRVQYTTFSVVAGWSLCVAVAAIADFHARGREAWRRSMPIQAVAAGLVLGALVLIAAPGTVGYFIERSQELPGWRGQDTGDPRHYYWILNAEFPVIFSLLPAVFAAVALKSLRLAVYLAVWFGVPFFIHSFLLPWRDERYIFLAMVPFFLAGGIAASMAWGWFHEGVRRSVASLAPQRGVARAVAGATVAVSAFFLVGSSPAFNESRKLPHHTVDLQWRTALELVRDEIPGWEELPVGSSKPLSTHYYWHRLDFEVARFWVDETEEGPVFEKDGTPDHYTGVPLLTEAPRIRSEFSGSPGVLIAIDPDRLAVDWQLSPTLREVLATEATEICRGRCGELALFHWAFVEGRAVAGNR